MALEKPKSVEENKHANKIQSDEAIMESFINFYTKEQREYSTPPWIDKAFFFLKELERILIRLFPLIFLKEKNSIYYL